MKSGLKKRRQAKLESKAEKSRAFKSVSRSKLHWNSKEHQACMEAIKKHGPNYNLIEKAVKTRSHYSIKHYIVKRLKSIKMNHPDYHILRVFKRRSGIQWTSKETDLLIKAIKKYGKDYKMFTNAVKTKTMKQIRWKVYSLRSLIASHPKHEHAKVIKKIFLRN